ncbi:hypothetical protein DENIS_2735 [Desulfonema ishimotonii]|uniref:DUF6575 domain-containing protein n=2 Tax=Desulfonema ishimotonii TaxID=45657 RepID=A0A401FXW6_9BACT|nr:hypothetical protein DENIS_2735 [Desulfonema ishimotonii]
MKKLKGTKLEKFVLKSQLIKVADLIYFDGPLLSHFKNKNSENYLYYWCDADNLNRWLIFRVSSQDLTLYLNKEITLYELIINPIDGFLYSVDIDENMEYRNIFMVQPDDLPESYIPEIDSYYEFEILHKENQDKNYRILINNDWKLDDLYSFPRNYSQVYLFIYSLQNLLKKNIDFEKLKNSFQAHPWKGGYSALNFYDSLNYIHRPEISSIQYASPGWIELKLFIPSAISIRKIITSFLDNSDALIEMYNRTIKELRLRRLTKIDARNAYLTPENALFIKETIKKFSQLMDFQYTEQLDNLTENPLISLKILLSFYRRVKNLSVYSIEGKASY